MKSAEKTLTVFCDGGLANRLRVLISGIAAAEVSNRTFSMIWPRSSSCAASFRELFTNNWPVQDVEKIEPPLLAYKFPTGGPFSSIQQLLSDSGNDIVIGSYFWIVDCQLQRYPDMYAICSKLLYELEPRPDIEKQITKTKELFRHVMIGVHLRRGDFLRLRPDVAWNTKPAILAVDNFLKKNPDAGIFLCTDDGAFVEKHTDKKHYEGIHEKFYRRFGDRVITYTSRSLDRRTSEGVQDALVDLWLLRSTNMIIGTTDSSFSRLAAYGHDAELVLVNGKSPAYSVIHWLALITGVHWLVCTLYRKKHGHFRPFSVAWKYFINTLTKRWKEIVK